MDDQDEVAPAAPDIPKTIALPEPVAEQVPQPGQVSTNFPLWTVPLFLAIIGAVTGFLITQVGNYGNAIGCFVPILGGVTGALAGYLATQGTDRQAWNAVPGQAPSGSAQPQGTASNLGCVFGCLMPLGLFFVLWKIMFPSHPIQPASAPAWPSPPPIAVENMSPEHQLASINAGSILPPTDPSVAQFRALLDRTRQQFPSQTDKNIADKWVYTWNQVKQREPNLSLLKFAQGMASIDMHGAGR